MEKQIRKFLEYIELERGHSQLTIRNYDAYLSKFADFAADHNIRSVAKIDLELIQKWRLALHRRELSNKTLNYYMIAIRSFLKYLSKMDIASLAPEKIELADTPERKINFLEENELERLIEAYSGSEIMELRNRAIVEVLFSTGIRVSELAGLNRDDINLKRKEFSVFGKGGKNRVVFLSESAASALGRYLTKRHDEDKALFTKQSAVSRQSSVVSRQSPVVGRQSSDEIATDKKRQTSEPRLTPRQIERVVREAGKRAGIVKKVTPHTIRHSFATDMLRSGVDIRSVQSFLGHANVTTTQVYTHVTDKHLREIHQKFHNKKKEE